jgi:RecA-family ATPase
VNDDNISENNYVGVEVITKTASDIQTQSVSWLWESFIPSGTVSFLFGEGGEGKSFFSLALAAAISNGQPLPGMEKTLPPSDVIVQNAENPFSMVIKPRLEMLGADCRKIHTIDDSDRRLTLLDDRIEAAIRKHNAALFIVDPFQNFLDDDFSMNRVESVRPAIMKLRSVAERTNSAILIVGHVNKSKSKAQHRGLGSIDILNSVPSVMYLGRAEGLEPDERAVAHGKSNFAELSKTQIFRLNKTDGFKWLGENEDITPDDIMNFKSAKKKDDTSKVDEAADFLLDILSDGAVPTAEVLELAEESVISKRTLERARKEIGVKSKKADGVWVMALSED